MTLVRTHLPHRLSEVTLVVLNHLPILHTDVVDTDCEPQRLHVYEFQLVRPYPFLILSIQKGSLEVLVFADVEVCDAVVVHDRTTHSIRHLLRQVSVLRRSVILVFLTLVLVDLFQFQATDLDVFHDAGSLQPFRGERSVFVRPVSVKFFLRRSLLAMNADGDAYE